MLGAGTTRGLELCPPGTLDLFSILRPEQRFAEMRVAEVDPVELAIEPGARSVLHNATGRVAEPGGRA
jgi:hypothetical protein